MQPYPQSITEDSKDHTNVLRIISRLRGEDITDRNKFPSIFVSGRKVGKVPSSSADVADTDRVSDMNWDADYFYICIQDGLSAAWRRIALATW